MTVRSRESRVLAILIVSMLFGAVILNALSNNPLSASAFCLSRYYHLKPVEESVNFPAVHSPGQWEQIEIHYVNQSDFDNQTKYEVDQLPQHYNSSENKTKYDNSDYHFIIYDGNAGLDGQIIATENWLSQKPINHKSQDCSEPSEQADRTIRICVIIDRNDAVPTDSQIRRTDALLEELCRRFRIGPDAIKHADS